MTTPLPATLPPNVPQFPRRLRQRFLRRVLYLCGWQIDGQIPDVTRLVVIVAPHSSWWDGFWGLMVKVALGIDIAFIAKDELFVGPLGWLLRRLGGIATDRRASHGTVGQIGAEFARRDKFWIGIAPEGTRRQVERWKSGFWQIAHQNDVPILPVYFHYPTRTIGFGTPVKATADMAGDIAAIRAWYAPFRGKYRNVS